MHKQAAEREKQHALMQLTNEIASFLLESEARDYFAAIVKSMEMICISLGIEHVHLWQNKQKEDGKLYYKQVCKWMRDGYQDGFQLLEFSYQDAMPNWKESLYRAESVQGHLDSFPETERQHFERRHIQSTLIVPIFLKDEFWGFASFDNCKEKREYDAAEEQLLRSWGLLALGAIERGMIAVNMQHTLTKLEAVIRNYKGIIWSTDNNGIITTFNGQHLKALGIEPSLLEGKHITEAKLDSKFLDAGYIERTFSEGPQDWMSERKDGGFFRSYTMPIRDPLGNISGLVGSTDDVTEIVTLQRDLKNAVEAANAASETKSRFLANMSHEMRTPLNAIIGLSELELGAENLQGDSFSNMEKIYSAGMNLLGIINDILDISKIESGKLTLIPVVYDVPSMINDTINLNIIRIGSRPIQFRLHVDGSLPSSLEGDELRVKQIFNNLLSNAIKYTNSGYVDWSISSVRDGDRVKVTSVIWDTGKGISKEDLKRLFRDYFKANLRANYYVEGTGLGLSITKNLIGLMDGTINVESEEGKGSAFTVEFYQSPAGDETIGEEAAENLSQFRFSTQRRSRNQKILRVDMSYASVLVVDDVETNFAVAQGMLKPYNLTVDCVTSGQAAIDIIREEKKHYDAIFMDHMMPGMDGIEAVSIIRNKIGTNYARNIPIIALTANALIGNDTLFLDSGFQAFLAKPIDILRMDQVLNKWVRNKEKEKTMVTNEWDSTEQVSAEKPAEKKNSLRETLHIPGLNVAAGLARFDNDEEAYLILLESFANHASKYVNDAQTFIEKQAAKSPDMNLDSFRIAVHSLKGSSRSIGAEELGNKAEKLEIAARQQDLDFIAANTEPFIKEEQALIAALGEFIKSMPTEDGPAKPEKDSPDPALLAAIGQAAESYDMAGLREAIEALGAYNYTSRPDLVRWLKDKADLSDFEAILKEIN